jgi:hypothetical protein
MPNLGAGVDQHVNTAAVPTWVYQPPANLSGSPYQANVRLFNEGTNIVYVGGANVSPFNGLPLFPNSRPVELNNVSGTLYSCSNVLSGSSVSTANAAYSANTNSFVTATSVPTANFYVGAPFLIGVPGFGQEVLVISTISTSYTTIGTTTNSLYDHKTGTPIYAATSVSGQLRVTAGT